MACLILSACCHDDPGNGNKSFYSYYFNYMDFPSGVAQGQNHEDNLITVEVGPNGNILKRTGDIRRLDGGTGFNYLFSKELYDTISYSSNQILIKRHLISDIFTAALFERKIILDGYHRMQKKIIYTEYFGSPVIDTVYYSYTANGKLSESRKSKRNNITERSSYHYNGTGNLDSIVSKKFTFNYLESKIVEVFSNYDNAVNPLVFLPMFEETFTRSLSKNNYRKYEKKFYYDDEYEGSDFKSWTLHYNRIGQVEFDQY